MPLFSATDNKSFEVLSSLSEKLERLIQENRESRLSVINSNTRGFDAVAVAIDNLIDELRENRDESSNDNSTLREILGEVHKLGEFSTEMISQLKRLSQQQSITRQVAIAEPSRVEARVFDETPAPTAVINHSTIVIPSNLDEHDEFFSKESGYISIDDWIADNLARLLVGWRCSTVKRLVKETNVIVSEPYSYMRFRSKLLERCDEKKGALCLESGVMETQVRNYRIKPDFVEFYLSTYYRRVPKNNIN